VRPSDREAGEETKQRRGIEGGRVTYGTRRSSDFHGFATVNEVNGVQSFVRKEKSKHQDKGKRTPRVMRAEMA